MMLCHSRGRFLFEVLPDIFPEGYLTDTEVELWEMHYQEQNERADKIRKRNR